jgi:iron complex outermembrane receptor protein
VTPKHEAIRGGVARRQYLTAAVALLFTAVLQPGQAGAQRDATGEPDPTDATRLDEVVVVGSRIRRSETETVQPVFTVERANIEASGYATVADLIQDLATSGAARNSAINNGGNGEERVDLRNLGEARTLVLLNGRRLSTTLDGAVDLSAIPLAAIERIEVLRDGASAIYGSDAIAGVINLHTRARPEQPVFDLRWGRHEAGDGDSRSAALTAGFGSDDATALNVNLSRLEQDPIFADARAISAAPIFGLSPTDTEAGASAAGPNGRFGFGPRGSCAFDPGGIYPAAGCSNPGRTPPIPATTYDPALGSWRLFDRATDGYNFVPFNYLQTPYERTAAFAEVSHALGDDARLRAEFLYNERRSAQQLAPSPAFLNTVFLGRPFTIPASNAYNPFNQSVVNVAFRPGGLARLSEQDADTLRAGFGGDGYLDAWGRGWYWDAQATLARQTVVQSRDGNLDLPRLLLALGPSFRDAGGSVRCGTPAAPIDGCVPIDIFRGEAGYTQAMRDYAYFRSTQRTRSTLYNLNVNVTGDLVDLPAGALAVAAGYEYRREAARFTPDERLREGDLSAGIAGLNEPIGGASRANEIYAEFAAPLAVEAPWAHVLELTAAARWSDYASFGSTTNLKGGLRWAPLPSLTLRANFAEGFRAPNLREQFAAPTRGLIGIEVSDGCATTAVVVPAPIANCIADGVPGGRYIPIGLLTEVIGGGNRDVLPETARDRTLGLVWSPPAWPDLDLSLDWYRITIDDAITAAGADVISAACLYQNVPEACARTVRDPASGQLLQIDARVLNSGQLDNEGWDLTVRWARDTGWGRFDLNWDATYVSRFVIEVPRSARPTPLPGNYFNAGGVGDPAWRWRSSLDLGWSRGDWRLNASVRHYPALDEACPLAAALAASVCASPQFRDPVFGTVGTNRIPAASYVDLQLAWRTPWDADLRIGATNLFDRDPPLARSSPANSYDPSYPIPGRAWYVGWTQRF